MNPQLESGTNNTADTAQSLGDLSTSSRGEAVGTIAAKAGAGDVDWYSFTLDRASTVSLRTLDSRVPGALVSVLSLYNQATPFTDYYDPFGYRLLAQSDGAGHGGDAQISRLLGPGTYFVAVSGSGNYYFNPLIAGSGYSGRTGSYGLLVTASNLGLLPADGPVVLATDPAPGAALSRSPFVLRVDLSSPLDPNTIVPGQNVQLIYNPTGTFGNGNDIAISLAQSQFNPAVNELELSPAAPLAPGYYRLVLGGDATSGNPVLASPNGTPLGANALHPLGQDFIETFQITGVDGNVGPAASADDTPQTAHQLGDITQAGLVQVAGAIGTDPTDPIAFDPASVDLYHFHLSGAGTFAFQAEVFAGRIGSPLDSGVSLFVLSPTDHLLHFVASNDDTRNPTQTSAGGFQPLYTDSYLFAGLTQGDYYVAVSSGGNVPMPWIGLIPGTNGIFDPNLSHSGSAGRNTGDYVLNLFLQPDSTPPRVVSVVLANGTTLQDGAVLSAPPTGFTVQFSKPVNVGQLAEQSFLQTGQNLNPAVYVVDSNGAKFYPDTLSSTQPATLANFDFLSALPTGSYTLHLSGSLGIVDLGGIPLAGNPTGDYVLHFSVNGSTRGTAGNSLVWQDQEPNNTFGQAQVLGALFPNELVAGVTINKTASVPSPGQATDTADFYRFQLLVGGTFTFALSSTQPLAGTNLALFDSAGNPVNTRVISTANSILLLASLAPGVYTVAVTWPASTKPFSDQLAISSSFQPDQPGPLTFGAAPTIMISHVTVVPPPPPPVVVSPGTPPPGLGAIISASAPGGPSHDLGAIPPGLLLSFATGPVGANTGIPTSAGSPANDIYERVLAQGPALQFSEAVVRLPILFQTQDSGTAQPATGGLAAIIQGLVSKLTPSLWEQLIDFLHSQGQPGDAQSSSGPEESGGTELESDVPLEPASEKPAFQTADTTAVFESSTNFGAAALLALFAPALGLPLKSRCEDSSDVRRASNQNAFS